MLFLVTQIFCYSSPGLEDIEILSNPFFLLHVFVRSIVSHFLTQFLIVLVTGFALLPESCDGALGNPVVAAGAVAVVAAALLAFPLLLDTEKVVLKKTLNCRKSDDIFQCKSKVLLCAIIRVLVNLISTSLKFKKKD